MSLTPVHAYETSTPEKPIDDEPMITMNDMLVYAICGSYTYAREVRGILQVQKRIVRTTYTIQGLADPSNAFSGYIVFPTYWDADGIGYDKVTDTFTNQYQTVNTNATYCRILAG